MYAMYMDHNLIKHELRKIGLAQELTSHFMRHSICHTLKIRNIPFSVLLELEKLQTGNNAAIYLYRDSDDSACAIISGTESELISAADVIKTFGDDSARLGETIERTINRATRIARTGIQLGKNLYTVGEKTLVMGILNVTPDSFSDGGRFDRIELALAQAYQMAEDGADIIDIGGESTRPGYEKEKRVTAKDELNRVMPIIEALKKESSFKLPLSIDTYKAETAERALEAGVEMLNDVWGFKEDSEIAGVAARYKVPVCLMHNRRNTDYQDLISDIINELKESIDLAHNAGVADKHIIIDPGIGFGKNYQQNLDVMLHLREFKDMGYPLLLGTSRKSIVGKTLNLPVDERIEGTAATIAYGISAGADIVRVHDVKQMKRVAEMTDAMVRR